MVAEALEFVKGLRLGDKLPTEVTTGDPSWQPSERHFLIAQQRLTLQLVTWMTGDEHIFTSAEQILMLAEDPQTKKNINLAFAEAAAPPTLPHMITCTLPAMAAYAIRTAITALRAAWMMY